MSTQDRREFLKRTAQGAAVAGTIALSGAARAAGANERLVAAVIGPGGMGTSHLKLLAENKQVDLAWVCDVDDERLAKAAETVQKLSGKAPKAVKDLRQVLDDKSVDAVWIATPDHWHGPATILACDAGKHVYVEKPCSHNIREGRLMALAVSTPARVAAFPDVPTIAEAGFPKGEFNFWVGVLAPAATPRDIVARLNEEINKALQVPDMKERFAKLGAEPMHMSPAQYDAFLRDEYNVLTEVMRASGAKPQ